MMKEWKLKIDWLLLFLILLPTFYVHGRDIRHMQMNFFQMAMFVLLGLFHVNRYFGLFILWVTFQFIFMDVPNNSYLVQNVFFAGFLYHFIVKYATVTKKYLWVFYLVLVFNVFWIPLQAANIDPVWSQANPQYLNFFSEYSGFFGLPAFMGNYAAVVLPLSFILSWWLFPFSLIAIFFSKSTFSILAAVTGSLFFFWFYKRILFWILAIVLPLGAAFYAIRYDMPTGQFSRRLVVWNLILKEAFTKQFMGHGIGAYHNRYTFAEVAPSHDVVMVSNNADLLKFVIYQAQQAGKPELVSKLLETPVASLEKQNLDVLLQSHGMDLQVWEKAHNEFIEAFFNYGLIGIALIFGFLFNLFRRFFKYSKDLVTLALASSAIGIVVVSLAHFPFQIARLAGPFVCILALFETRLIDKESDAA